jgi:hypothetical protein
MEVIWREKNKNRKRKDRHHWMEVIRHLKCPTTFNSRQQPRCTHWIARSAAPKGLSTVTMGEKW